MFKSFRSEIRKEVARDNVSELLLEHGTSSIKDMFIEEDEGEVYDEYEAQQLSKIIDNIPEDNEEESVNDELEKLEESLSDIYF